MQNDSKNPQLAYFISKGPALDSIQRQAKQAKLNLSLNLTIKEFKDHCTTFHESSDQ